jgi:YD repeat-containing protein
MTGTYTCVYDAWHRLVEVKDGANVVAQYRYDAAGWRIRKYVPDGSNWTVTEYYYNASWQVMEIRRDGGKTRSGSPLSEPTLATTLHEQYVWSPRYIDSPGTLSAYSNDILYCGYRRDAETGRRDGPLRRPQPRVSSAPGPVAATRPAGVCGRDEPV